MKVRRVTEPLELNAAVNDPDTLKQVAPGYESFDMTFGLANPRNICLRCGGAYAFFHNTEPGCYRGHYFYPRSVRGKSAVGASKKMLREMFTTYSASAIHGLVPRSHRAARVLTRRLGFVPVGEEPDTFGRKCVHYVMDRDTWEASSDLAAARKQLSLPQKASTT